MQTHDHDHNVSDTSGEIDPLLPTHNGYRTRGYGRVHSSSRSNPELSEDETNRHLYRDLDSDSNNNSIRDRIRHFLVSKYAHYMVIILVGLDIAGTFADFLISLHVCEHTCGDRVIGDPNSIDTLKGVSAGLGVVSLVFSALFMIELILSIYAFGIGYFKVPFHILDAASIIASFLVDMIERGQTAEAGSLIITLRLFRVFKIIEEGSTAAEQLSSDLEEKIRSLEEENARLRRLERQ